ncbi:MAG: ATP-dependent Clp protease ATP-binding subunit [Anaerolineae bacterium]|nr:ATP-dependent Clp protease ATP-binding subunit [Anaerolineae bacterium]
MLEKFSPKSQRCFDTAKQEARRLQNSRLDTGHLFLGLLRAQPDFVEQVFRPFNVETAQVIAALEAALGRGETPSPPRLKVTDRLKAALQHSNALAKGGTVNPEHLFIALLEVDEDVVGLLNGLGVRTDELLAALRSAPAKTAEPSPIPTGPAPSTAEGPAPGCPTPVLDTYARDLTALAREGKLYPVLGRDRELADMIEILCRQKKRNPILVGEPGTGKTALAEGLAQKIVSGQVPPLFRDKRIAELSISSLTAGASMVGEFEKRLQAIVREVQQAGNVIVFIDEVHALVGAGGTPGLQDAATILKPALARGELICIGATTTHDYRKYVEKDGALARRFQPVRVDEPPREVTLDILESLRPRFEAHFGVTIPSGLLTKVYELAKQFLKNRYFPDKGIDLLERAAAREMLAGGENPVLDEATLLSVLSDITGIPLEQLDETEMDRYLRMEEILKQRVIGQDEAVNTVASLLRLTKRRLDIDPTRPDGVFLFIGPTGVGKMELAKAVTEFLFGDEERLIRLDMSEYSADFTVSRLIGSPPGYVGYTEGGQLTEQVYSQPFCVLLLDEIEKAHPAVLNLFLQVFDDGRLTDAQGRTVYFSDATVIMTSNLGNELWFKRRLGFGHEETPVEEVEEAVLAELHKRLPSEFLARIDEIVVFHPLSDTDVRKIVRQKLDLIIRARFQQQGIEVTFTDDIIDFVVQHGFDARLGGRHLERTIQKEVLEPLAAETYKPEWAGVSQVQVTVQDGQIHFHREA